MTRWQAGRDRALACWAGSPGGLADWGRSLRATACPAHLAHAERPDQLELHTWNSLLVFSHSQKLPARHQPLCLKAEACRADTQRASLWGPGRSHWAGPQGSGLAEQSSYFPDDALSAQASCPRGPPEHLPGLFIYPVSTLPASRGTEFIFHNSSINEEEAFPPFQMWTLRLREVQATLLKVTQRPSSKGGTDSRLLEHRAHALPRIHCSPA